MAIFVRVSLNACQHVGTRVRLHTGDSFTNAVPITEDFHNSSLQSKHKRTPTHNTAVAIVINQPRYNNRMTTEQGGISAIFALNNRGIRFLMAAKRRQKEGREDETVMLEQARGCFLAALRRTKVEVPIASTNNRSVEAVIASTNSGRREAKLNLASAEVVASSTENMGRRQEPDGNNSSAMAVSDSEANPNSQTTRQETAMSPAGVAAGAAGLPPSNLEQHSDPVSSTTVFYECSNPIKLIARQVVDANNNNCGNNNDQQKDATRFANASVVVMFNLTISLNMLSHHANNKNNDADQADAFRRSSIGISILALGFVEKHSLIQDCQLTPPSEAAAAPRSSYFLDICILNNLVISHLTSGNNFDSARRWFDGLALRIDQIDQQVVGDLGGISSNMTLLNTLFYGAQAAAA